MYENPPPTPENPQDPAEVARRQMRLEQQMMEARLDILQTARKQKESGIRRTAGFLLVFLFSGLVAWALDHKGKPPEVSIGGAVLTIVVVGTWFAYRKTY